MQTTEPTPIATTAVMNLFLLRRLDKMPRRLATLHLLAALHNMPTRHLTTLSLTNCAPEALNEHETIVAVDDESLPQTARLFEALRPNLEMLSAEGAKFAQAHMKQQSEDEVAEAVTQKTATK